MRIGIGIWRRRNMSLGQQAMGVLRKFGTNAHLYLPGVGMVDGVTAGNYLDSAGTTAATVDGLVGLVTDSLGAVNASQSTGANRPTERRGIVNNKTYSHDLSQAAGWTFTASSYATGKLDPNGGSSAFKIIESATNAQHYVTGGSVTVGTPSTFAAVLKQDGRGWATLTSWTSYANFDLVNGVVGNTGVSTGLSIAAMGNGYFLCVLNWTPVNTQGAVISVNSSNTSSFGPSYIGDGASGIDFYGCALFTGTLTAAQILAAGGIPLTTTTAASSTAGNYALQFNGTSNYLSLSAPLFQQTDDWCVVAGAQSNSAAANCVFSNAAGGASEALPEIGFDSSGHAYLTLVGGGTTVTLTSSSTYIGTPVVICARKVGSTIVLRINGVQVATGSTSGTYTTATNGAIGALPRSSVTDYHLGMIYGMPIIKGTVTDADMLTQERWVAALTAPVSGMVAF